MKWALLAGKEDRTWTEMLGGRLGELSSRKLKVVGLEAWAAGGNGIVIPLETAVVATYWEWPFAAKFGARIAVLFPAEMGQVEGEGASLQWLVTSDGLKLSWKGDPGFLGRIFGLSAQVGEKELGLGELPLDLHWFSPHWQQLPSTGRPTPPSTRTMTEFWEEPPGPAAAGDGPPPSVDEVAPPSVEQGPEVVEKGPEGAEQGVEAGEQGAESVGDVPAPAVDVVPVAPTAGDDPPMRSAEEAPVPPPIVDEAPPRVEEEPPATPSEPLQPVVEEPAVGEERPGRAGVAADSTGDLGDLDDLTLESAEIPKPAPVQMPAPVRPQGTAVLSPHPVKPVGTAPEHFGVADPFAAPAALPTQISCLHPHLCQPEAPFLLEVVLHLPEAAPSPSRPGEKVERALGNVQLPAGAQLRVEVRPPPGFSVDSPHSTLSWLPPSSRVGFLLTADKEVREGSHIIPVLLYPADGSVAFCRVYATVEVGKVGSAVTDTGHRPTVQIPQKIFASYASKDRAEVLERVASLKALGIDVFVDCLDIAEGQRWEEGIQRQICSRDALLLFWSRAAAASRWVEQEWKLALAERGLDYIFPNALEAPSLCPPPPPLAALQFGSTLLSTPWSDPSEAAPAVKSQPPTPSLPDGAPAALPAEGTAAPVKKQRRWWLLIGGFLAALVLCTGGLGLIAALAGWWAWAG